jgi:hypothetical protein
MNNKRYALWAFLIFLILVIFVTLERLYVITSNSINPGLATIGVSIVIISLFTLCLASMAITGLVVAAVRRGWISPRPGSLLEKIVILWRQFAPTYYHSVLVHKPDGPAEPAMDEDAKDSLMGELSAAELENLLSFISSGKGRGRKSQEPEEDRFFAVRDWTIMQMNGTSVKLQDFLDARFGTYDSGHPRVPTATFYGWRNKIKKEMKKYNKSKRKIKLEDEKATPSTEDRDLNP